METNLAVYNYSTALTRADELEIVVLRQGNAKANIVNAEVVNEVARMGAHATQVVAGLTHGADTIRMRLLEDGVRSQIFDDAREKILQVTAQNIIGFTAAAQKVVMAKGAEAMR
jgi:hypothetical protein